MNQEAWSFKNILKKFQILSVDKRYILFDWFASFISFICTWYIYHESPNMKDLGSNGWTLSLLATSLFVSSAAQYYIMFRKQSIFYTYLYFLPIIFLEIIILKFLVPNTHWLLISICLLTNVLFAAFRGSFMAVGAFPKAAICNILEQICRFIVMVILVNLGFNLANALLLGSTIVYTLLSLFVLIYLIKLKKHKNNIFSTIGFKEAFKFAIVNIGIYILMNGDVLSLKNFSQIKGQFVLLKPWGQIFIIVLTPLINLYLWKIENNKSTKKLYLTAIGLFITFSTTAILFGKEINFLLFNKSNSSNFLIEIVLIEHMFIALVLAILYRILDLKINYTKAIQILIISVSLLITMPYILADNYIYLGYVGLYSILFVFYHKSLLLKKTITSTGENILLEERSIFK